MNFFWHSRLMSGWSKTFVLCKKKRRNCCKSWTNWQREILGLDVPFLDEKIIAKYLRILPSHLKVTTHTGAKWHILSKNSTWPQMTSLASNGLKWPYMASVEVEFLDKNGCFATVCKAKKSYSTRERILDYKIAVLQESIYEFFCCFPFSSTFLNFCGIPSVFAWIKLQFAYKRILNILWNIDIVGN